MLAWYSGGQKSADSLPGCFFELGALVSRSIAMEENVFDVLAELDERGELRRGLDLCVRFMFSCCDLVKADFPEAALRALEVARNYWSGAVSGEDLLKEQRASWGYLNKLGSMNLEDPRVCAMRAVVCLLYPYQQGADIYEEIVWFLEVINRVRDCSAEQRRILEELFVAGS